MPNKINVLDPNRSHPVDYSLDAARGDMDLLIQTLCDAGFDVRNATSAMKCPFHETKHPSHRPARIENQNGVWRFRCRAGACGFCEDIFGVKARLTGRQTADVMREWRATVAGANHRPSTPATTPGFFETSKHLAAVRRDTASATPVIVPSDPPLNENGRRKTGEWVKFNDKECRVFNTPEEWHAFYSGLPGKTVIDYSGGYSATNFGELKYLKARVEPGFSEGQSKTFVVAHVHDDGKVYCCWRPETIKPLYFNRTAADLYAREISGDENARFDDIVVVEGEKAADALDKVDVPAVSLPFGADEGGTKMLTSDWSPLARKSVILWGDHDPVNPKTGNRTGHEFMRNLAVYLRNEHGCTPCAVDEAGIASNDDGYDVADFLAENEGGNLKAMVETVISDAKPFVPPVSLPVVELKDSPAANQREAYAATTPLIESPVSTPSHSASAERAIVITKRRWPNAMSDAAFIGPIGEWVQKIAPHTEADPAAMLIQALTAFGNIIGRNAYVMVGGSEQHANLFAVMVGESALARKGTGWKIVHRLMVRVAADWASDRIIEGIGSGEAVIFRLHDGVWINEKNRKTGKYESIQKAPPVADKRLHIHDEEFKGTLTVCGKPTSTLSPVIRKAWDGGKLESATKNDPMSASNAHVSMTAHITMQELNESLDTTAIMNGFGNRYLWAGSKRARVLPSGDKSHLQEVGDIVRRLSLAVDRGTIKREFAWTPDASVLWQDFYVNKPAPKGDVGELTKRDDTYIHRLAMIYAILDDDCDAWMHERHFRAALAVWNYCKDSAECIFARRSSGSRIGKLIVSQLTQHPEGFNRTQISKALGNNKSAAEIDNEIETLLAADQITQTRVMKVDTMGRERTTFLYQLASGMAGA